MADAERDLFRETAGACRAAADRCQHVECRHNLIDPGRLRHRSGQRRPVRKWACVLEAVNDGPLPTETIAQIFGVTRALIQQIEVQATKKVRRALAP